MKGLNNKKYYQLQILEEYTENFGDKTPDYDNYKNYKENKNPFEHEDNKDKKEISRYFPVNSNIPT